MKLSLKNTIYLGIGLWFGGLGLAAALLWSVSKDLPSLEQLETYEPRLITKLISSDGVVIKEFYTQRRVYVPLESMPENLVNAALATEDRRFYKHWGIDIIRLMKAMAVDIATLSKKQGASTITQQLARNLYFTHKQTISRKLKEFITAIQIERHYSKNEILEMYFTQTYFGGGAYGIQSAAQRYFSKNIEDLELDECALLVAILKAPARYSPIHEPERALKRRNLVLYNMYNWGVIDYQSYKDAASLTLRLNPTIDGSPLGMAPYFTEYIRQQLEKKEEQYGFDYYHDGLTVYTTLDSRLQASAEEALIGPLKFKEDEIKDFGAFALRLQNDSTALRDYILNIFNDRELMTLNAFEDTSSVSDSLKSVIIEVLNRLLIRENSYNDSLFAGIPLRNKTRLLINENPQGKLLLRLNRLLLEDAYPEEIGLSESHLDFLDEQFRSTFTEKQLMPFLAAQFPDSLPETLDALALDSVLVDSLLKDKLAVQVAMVVIEPGTGKILAMIGGRDFGVYKFNRAVQTVRQPGSAFKPFVYLTAIDNGYPPTFQLLNQDVVVTDDNGKRWTPRNYDLSRGGLTTLREGLRRSLNLISARLVQEVVPPHMVVDYAKKLGITTRIAAVDAIALGSSGVIPLEIVSAFSVFAAGGVLSDAYCIVRIEDKHGNVIEENTPHRTVVISEQSAYMMTNMLETVINQGTGGSVRWKYKFYNKAAGKTGTTNDFTDAWFIGFTPYLCAGVWVGMDDPFMSLGAGQSGGRAALPIWAKFMKEACDSLHYPNDEFVMPEGIIEKEVCTESYKLATKYCPNTMKEVFIEKYAPSETCPIHSGRKKGK